LKQILDLCRRIITGWAKDKCTVTKSELFSYAIYKLALKLLITDLTDFITDRLRHAKTFTSFPVRTEKFRKSFIPYCL